MPASLLGLVVDNLYRLSFPWKRESNKIIPGFLLAQEWQNVLKLVWQYTNTNNWVLLCPFTNFSVKSVMRNLRCFFALSRKKGKFPVLNVGASVWTGFSLFLGSSPVRIIKVLQTNRVVPVAPVRDVTLVIRLSQSLFQPALLQF